VILTMLAPAPCCRLAARRVAVAVQASAEVEITVEEDAVSPHCLLHACLLHACLLHACLPACIPPVQAVAHTLLRCFGIIY